MNEKELKQLAAEEYPSPKYAMTPTGNRRLGSDCYLQEQNAFIKGYEKAQEWVSVEDRLPEIDKEVLIVDISGKRISTATFTVGNYDGEGWIADFEDIYPTHWKNLPTPPKEK